MMFSFNGLCLLYKMRRAGGGTGDHCVVCSQRKASARED